MGYRPEGFNPCRGYDTAAARGHERYLSDSEIGRLGTTLSAQERERSRQVAAIRLLLLTGYRENNGVPVPVVA